MNNVKAYLIAICDKETNEIKEAAIWSSPEWEQSRFLPDCHTYVAYECVSDSFQNATIHLIHTLQDKRCRYHYFLKYLNDFKDNIAQEYSIYDEQNVFVIKVLAMSELSALNVFAGRYTQYDSYIPLRKAGWSAEPCGEKE